MVNRYAQVGSLIFEVLTTGVGSYGRIAVSVHNNRCTRFFEFGFKGKRQSEVSLAFVDLAVQAGCTNVNAAVADVEKYLNTR